MMPFSEQSNLFSSMNFALWKEDPQDTTSIGQNKFEFHIEWDERRNTSMLKPRRPKWLIDLIGIDVCANVVGDMRRRGMVLFDSHNPSLMTLEFTRFLWIAKKMVSTIENWVHLP